MLVASNENNPKHGEVLFSDLVALEPRLEVLRREALAWREQAKRGFCANAVFYGSPGQPGLKQRLSELVGYERAGRGVLGTSEAYETAYHTVYQSLPNCRHRGECGSFRKPPQRQKEPHEPGCTSEPVIVWGSDFAS